MGRVAKKDTIATEQIFDGAGEPIEVQRRVFAGDTIPDQYEVKDSEVEDLKDRDYTPHYRPGKQDTTVRVRRRDLDSPQGKDEIEKAVRTGKHVTPKDRAEKLDKEERAEAKE